jgi:hypothetical protein
VAKHSRTLGAFLLAAALAVTARPAPSQAGDCTFKGIPLHGRVQVVHSFGDIKVQVVRSFPDLRVEKVASFPSRCGQWEFVTSFPDFTIEEVSSFPDLKIEYVDSFPGEN